MADAAATIPAIQDFLEWKQEHYPTTTFDDAVGLYEAYLHEVGRRELVDELRTELDAFSVTVNLALPGRVTELLDRLA